MAAPAQPTATTIVTEALKRFLNTTDAPDAADISRATDYGLEKAKRDIMLLGRKWRPLLITCYDILAAGISHYDNPSDFECDFDAYLMRGEHTGTLSAVTSASNVTLAADEDVAAADAPGRWLLITSGTGVDQAQQISAYNATTKVCVMAAAYATAPVQNDTYMIVTEFRELRYKHPKLYDRYDHPGSPGVPSIYSNLKNSSIGQFVVYPVPNNTMGVRRRYYADFMRLDVAGTLYSTILRRWAPVLEQGVYVWKLGEDDDRFQAENQIYQGMLQALAVNDLDGQPAIQGQQATANTKAT